MARIIKQGSGSNCRFLAHDKKVSQPASEQEHGSFDTLFHLFPGKPLEEGNKGNGSGASDQDLDPAEVERERCRAIIQAADMEAQAIKAEAEEVLAAAKARAAEIESQAYSDGYEQGQKDGEDFGRKQFAVGLQHLESVLKNLRSESRRLVLEYEAQMVQTCLMVAGKLVAQEIKTDRDLISRILRIAMEKAVDGSSVTVHLNPRDKENLSDEFIEQLSGPGGNSILLKANGSVKRGGCLIETEFGLIDASIESRWQALLEEVGETLKDRTGQDLSEEVKKLMS